MKKNSIQPQLWLTVEFKNLNPHHCGWKNPSHSQIGLYFLDLLSVGQFKDFFLIWMLFKLSDRTLKSAFYLPFRRMYEYLIQETKFHWREKGLSEKKKIPNTILTFQQEIECNFVSQYKNKMLFCIWEYLFTALFSCNYLKIIWITL